MIDTLWNISVLDIEETLRAVCMKVFCDTSVSPEVRILRAQGLYIMGKIFQECGKSSKEGLDAIKKQLREGMQVAQAQAAHTEGKAPDANAAGANEAQAKEGEGATAS